MQSDRDDTTDLIREAREQYTRLAQLIETTVQIIARTCELLSRLGGS